MCAAASPAERLGAATELDLDVLAAVCSQKLFGGSRFRFRTTTNMAESVNNSAELLEDFLRCMVCFESFKEPKVLQCQHTFCQQCLTNWNGKGGGTAKGISCPTCRVRTPLPENSSIASLPSDFKVSKLCELLQQVLVRPEEEESRACDICAAGGERKVASHFCAQCSESFCPMCCERHSSNNLFNTHHVVDLSTQASSGKLFCKEHGSKPIKYICMACNIFICTVCAINVHNGDDHNVQDMEYGMRKHVEHLKSISDKIELKLEEVKGYHEQLCEVQVLLKALHDNLEEKIDERVTSHIDKASESKNILKKALATPSFGSEYRNITWAVESMLEMANHALHKQGEAVTHLMKERRITLTDELKIKHQETNRDVNARIDSVSFHIASIESLASFLEHLMQNLNHLEIITIYDDLVTRVNSILDTEPECLTPKTFTVFSFDPDSGEYDLGVLLEEEVTAGEFIERMAEGEDTEEEEVIMEEEQERREEEEQREFEDEERRMMRESQEAINVLDAMLEEEGGGTSSELESPTTPNHTANDPTTPNHTANDPTSPNHTANDPTTPNHTANDPTTPNHTANDPTTPNHTANDPTTPNHTANDPTTPNHTAHDPNPTSPDPRTPTHDPSTPTHDPSPQSPTNIPETGQEGHQDISPVSTVSSNASSRSAPGVTMRTPNPTTSVTTSSSDDPTRRYSLPVMSGASTPKLRPEVRSSTTMSFTGLTASSQPLTPPQETEAPPSYDGSSSSVSSSSTPARASISNVASSTSAAEASTPSLHASLSNTSIGRSISLPETNGSTSPAMPRDGKEYYFEAQPLQLLWEKIGPQKTSSGSKKQQSGGKRNRTSSSGYIPGSAPAPDLRYPTDVSFLRNGSVIVADAVDRSLQILSTDTMMWSKVRDRKQPFVSVRPIAWGQLEPVCVIPTMTEHLDPALVNSLDAEYVTITDARDKCIKLIDLHNKNGTIVSTWGKSWFNPMFKQPSGVTVTRQGKWIVTDIGRHSVSMHDHDGRCILQFGSRGKGAYGFEQPRYVAVDQHDRILVSDSGNGGVKVYDTNGQFLLKIGSKESMLTCPMGVCVDDHGHIIVADKHRHCVNLFNTDGRLVKQIIGPKDNIRYPTGVSVSSYGQLAVSMLEPSAVKFFEIRS